MKDEDKTKAELIKELKFLQEERKKEAFKDITKPKQAEQVIQESESRFRELFNHMSSGVAVYEAKDNGKDFIFKDYNQAAEKIDKAKKEDIIGKSVLQVFSGVKDFGLFRVFQEVYQTGKPQHHHISFYQDQRITGWRENHVYKLSSGEIVAVYDDITERKQMEKEIKNAAVKWQTTFDSMNDAVSLVDNNGIVLQCNQSYLNLFGKTETDISGKHCWEIAHGTNKPIDDCPYEKMKKSYQRESIVLPIDDKWFNVVVDPIFDAKNNLINAVHIITDITKRKQAEKDLKEAHDHLENKVAQRTEELQNANLKLRGLDRLKSMFIATMSHELRTPISLVIELTNILLNEISGEINKEQRKQLTLVKSNANYLLDLINGTIDISKIEAGKTEITIEEFDLFLLSQEIKNAFTGAADKKGLELSLEIPPTLQIESDKRRIKQILVNLLSNAIKFTDRGEIKIKVFKKDKIVEISVRDTGIGIKKEDMNKLFNAFFRIPTLDRTVEGTGLGLYLSKKNANLLGGDIMTESELGKGSIFTLILPLKYKETKG